MMDRATAEQHHRCHQGNIVPEPSDDGPSNEEDEEDEEDAENSAASKVYCSRMSRPEDYFATTASTRER